MPQLILDYFSDHLLLAALLVSGLWFYAGYQYVSRRKRAVGITWQFIGVAVLIAFCVDAIRSASWYSLVIVLVAMAGELLLIRQCWRENHVENN